MNVLAIVEVRPKSDVQLVVAPARRTIVLEVSRRGPQGPPGTAGAGYTYTQGTPSMMWTVNHNLGIYPSVTVFDTGGAEIDVLAVNVSPNQTIIYFNTPRAGSARFI